MLKWKNRQKRKDCTSCKIQICERTAIYLLFEGSLECYFFCIRQITCILIPGTKMNSITNPLLRVQSQLLEMKRYVTEMFRIQLCHAKRLVTV